MICARARNAHTRSISGKFSGSDRAGRSYSESHYRMQSITFYLKVSRFGDRTQNDNFKKVTKIIL